MEETRTKPPLRAAPLLRLSRFVLQYKFRIFAGLFLSLVVSITNLFSLTIFIPIFNALGETEKVELFPLGASELEKYDRFQRGEDLPIFESINARWTGFKVYSNEWVEDKTPREAIFSLCLLVLPIYFLKTIGLSLSLYFIGTAGTYAIRDIRNLLYSKLNRMGLDYFEQGRTGIIMSRVINDVQLVGRSLSIEFQEAVVNLFYIITHLVILALISWEMLLAILLVVPILIAPVNKFAVKIRRAAMGQQERLAEMGGHVQEIISGIRVIRAFSMEKFEQMRFNIINHRLFRNTFKGHYYHQVGPAITEFVATLVVVIFLGWGAYEISSGDLSRGMFFGFFFILIFIMRPMKQVSIMVNLMGASSAAAERIFEILDDKPRLTEAKDPIRFGGVRDTIQFDNVSFRYPGSDQDALKNVNVSVEAGQTVSIVGSSGAGKSTFIDLLPRFYDPTGGRILVDGKDLKNFRLNDLRERIGIVTQSVFLFNATLRDNITLGRVDIPEEEVVRAARAAHAHKFISALHEGYDTLVGERGVMLSGGQRQRIAIARAILHNPPVLIFDEATSALDNESEKMVQEAINTLLRGRTVFIVAHRLSTVTRSDRILVMDQGRIVETGDHKTLLEKGGIYRRLYEMQFAVS
ncbi:MAG: ABC transporter ATP-binding protein [Leptospiraceae bacterium]